MLLCCRPERLCYNKMSKRAHFAMKNKHYSTSTKPKKKSRKKLLIILVAVILAAGAGMAWYRYQGPGSENHIKSKNTGDIRPQNSVDYSPADPRDNTATENEKSNPNDKGTLNTPNQPADFSVVVTGANPNPNDRVVRVSSLVNGSTEGTCKVVLTKEGQADVTETGPVALQNNSYICPVFTISYDRFPVSGDWNVRVEVTKGPQTATGTWQGGAITVQK